MFSWCVEESENNSDQTAIVKAKEHSTQVGVFDIVEKLEAELGYLKDTVQSINQSTKNEKNMAQLVQYGMVRNAMMYVRNGTVWHGVV